MAGIRVIGMGQRVAGDDGAGLAALAALRAGGVPAGVELVVASDGSALIEQLDTSAEVILVDAALAPPPGRVLVLTPAQLAQVAGKPLSSHGLDAVQALALASVLLPDLPRRIRIVAITIAAPQPFQVGLTEPVAAAVPQAVQRVLELTRSPHHA
jgi:hydrogenase maturation protease